MPEQRPMDEMVAGLNTKSAKIRRLGAAGYTRRQIADFLGIRYQFVRNVLVDEERKRKGDANGMAEPKSAWRAEPRPADAKPGRGPDAAPYGGIRVQPDGTGVVPASIMAQAGYRPGDYFVAIAAGQGDLRLLTGEPAITYARKLIREHIPEDVDLLEELRELRRRQFEREGRLFGEGNE